MYVILFQEIVKPCLQRVHSLNPRYQDPIQESHFHQNHKKYREEQNVRNENDSEVYWKQPNKRFCSQLTIDMWESIKARSINTTRPIKGNWKKSS